MDLNGDSTDPSRERGNDEELTEHARLTPDAFERLGAALSLRPRVRLASVRSFL
jgi:hypothetical protein